MVVDQSKTHLRQLRALLLQIPKHDVVEPRVRVALVLRDAEELAGLLARREVCHRLEDVGVDEAEIGGLDPAIEALREAETAWVQERDAGKEANKARAEQTGYALREELMAACRFNLGQLDVGPELARITDSEEAEDLRHDLLELAELVEGHPEHFRRDRSFAATERVEEARQISAEIGAQPGEPTSEAMENARALRNLAFTHLTDMVIKLREAGLYAFRGSALGRSYFATHLTNTRRVSELGSMVRTRIA
jgi:hypothetical protein